jgi:hypothetical protein
VVERVDLAAERHAERQRWRNGGEWDASAAFVAVGELADGRWYARRYGRCVIRACSYSGTKAEHYARATARRWMRTIGGEWVAA